MTVVHISQLVNSLFHAYCERLSADRLWRVQKVAFFPGSDAMVAEDCVLHGAPYMALFTFKGVRGTRTSAAIFSFSKCLVDNKIVPNPSVQGLRDTPNATVRGQFMSFKKDGISNLVWTSRFGAPVDLHPRGMCFVDLNVNEQGLWEVDRKVLDAFVRTVDKLETCPIVHAETYEGVEQSSTRPTVPRRCCKFCDEAIPLNEMLDYVAGHMEKDDTMVDPKWVGDADACAFCGATNGSCRTIVVKGKVVSDCTYKWHIKYKKALRAQHSVPRPCPLEMCTATPYVLDVRRHLLLKDEATDWVVNAPKEGRKGKHKRMFTRAIAPPPSPSAFPISIPRNAKRPETRNVLKRKTGRNYYLRGRCTL